MLYAKQCELCAGHGGDHKTHSTGGDYFWMWGTGPDGGLTHLNAFNMRGIRKVELHSGEEDPADALADKIRDVIASKGVDPDSVVVTEHSTVYEADEGITIEELPLEFSSAIPCRVFVEEDPNFHKPDPIPFSKFSHHPGEDED